MNQNHSKAFVNITGSVFVSIFIIIGACFAISFSNEDKANSLSKKPDPEKYWDESMCRCLEEDEPKPAKTVFIRALNTPTTLLSIPVLYGR